MGGYTGECAQGSVLGPFFFLLYIDDLVENAGCNIKLFADDASLFQLSTMSRKLQKN